MMRLFKNMNIIKLISLTLINLYQSSWMLKIKYLKLNIIKFNKPLNLNKVNNKIKVSWISNT